MTGVQTCALPIYVDCGANAEAFIFRSVPTDGSNYLLSDVVDGVTLALRILSTANNDLLRSRSSALLAANKPKIAHAIERVIACLARIVAIRPRGQSVWALDQPGERRALRQ